MKIFGFAMIAVTLFAACDRRPVRKDLPHSEGSPGHSKMQHSEMESSPNAAAAPYELQFLDTMTAHHEAAIDMAQLAQTRAQHEELKALAKTIIANQQKEIAQMNEWRDKHFAGMPPAINMELPGMRDSTNEMDLEKLDQLKENAFDTEFIRQMIAQHNGAVTMANNALQSVPEISPQRSSDQEPPGSELRTFTQSIIDTRTDEIAPMKRWQSAWTK